MNLLQRTGFYMIGVALGGVIVYYILDKKKTTFCYLPNCRVLKDISLKKRDFSPTVQELIDNKKLDTAIISYTYKEGNINFSKSKTKQKSCKQYYIDSKYNERNYEFLIENCDSIALVKQVIIK